MRVAVAALVIAGCGGWDATGQATVRAREVLACEEVSLEPRADAVWVASGCGRVTAIACTSGANEPRCMRVRLAGLDVAPAPVEADAAEVEPAGEGASDVDGAEGRAAAPSPRAVPVDPSLATRLEAERVVRAAVQARRDDVLACVARPRVVVRVAWPADGPSALSLPGALEGSAEEGCVRAALGELGPPVPRDAGALLELVRGE